MSESSSDTESSCGWTILSNEGSDIETLGSDVMVEDGTEMLESSKVEELESQASASAALCVEEKAGEPLDSTLGEQTVEETLHTPQVGESDVGKEHVLSSSDHSDIVTLGELKEGEHTEEAATASEELFLGTSCSSHYTFTALETVFPVETNSSSSEDEVGQRASPVLRRRRVRKNTTSVVTDPEGEEEGSPESCSSEAEEEEEADIRPAAPLDERARGPEGSILNKCILLALIIAVSMGFGHFHGTVQIQGRQKTVEKIQVNELVSVGDLLQRHVREQLLKHQRISFDRDDLDERQVVSLLSDLIEKIKRENQELSEKRDHVQAQRDDLEMLLKQTSEERTNVMVQQQSLKDENLLLKSSLEHDEKSLTILQEELRNLRFKIGDLEAMGAENQKLKSQLEEEQQQIRDFHVQRENMRAEAQILREKLDKERRGTEELRRELSLLRSRMPKDSSEAEDLQRRLTELEKRLSFEQQRSDLWERLYVETKDERAKGDPEINVKKAKGGMAGRVKETFDAVKNSTKEFVHHHKEQIKKAKEAVKENLRKFSDSVKSTFRHFKDSATTLFHKAQSFYKKRRDQRSHKSHHPRNEPEFFHNTRKSGRKVQEEQGHHRSGVKGCTGVFDCAYQESMSLFNTATEPIRAEEFHLLLQSYLQQEVEHFYHWKELEMFINNFFHNGVFIHDRMLFTDFVSGVEDYLTEMHEYHGLDDDNVFGDLDDFVYRHFYGEAYTKSCGPRRPFQKPNTVSEEESRAKQQQRKQQRARSRVHSERKWSRSGRNSDRHMADVKIELGPMPFDPKY
uniref:Cell cycle progression 1 n=1 Tax=Nothobranchius rachovii TaxID=451742 RepID=A0A1A8SIC6_9TELE